MLAILHQLFSTELETQNLPSSAIDCLKKYAPFAQGVQVNGLMAPTSEILRGNQSCDELCNRLPYAGYTGILFWYSRIQKTSQLKQEISQWLYQQGMYVQQQTIPVVRYISNPEWVKVEWMTPNELIVLYNISTVFEFAQYILCTIVLGVYLNDFIATTVLQIENLNEFISARLFQGYFDEQFSMFGEPSSFVPFGSADMSSSYDSTPFYQSIQGTLSSSAFDQLVLQQQNLVNNSTFIGNSPDTVVAMHELELLKLPHEYVQYLKTPSSLPKVGSAVFTNITHGRGRRGYKNTTKTLQNTANQEVPHPIVSTPQAVGQSQAVIPTAPSKSQSAAEIVMDIAPSMIRGFMNSLFSGRAENGAQVDPTNVM